MAISYVASGTTGTHFNGSGSNNYTPNMPTHAVNDLLILNTIFRYDGTVTGPSGWTLLASDAYSNGSRSFQINLWYKIATTTSESAAYNTNGSSTGMGGGGHRVSVLRGSDLTTPIASVATATHDQNNDGYGAQSFASLTVTRDGSWRAVTAGYWSTGTGFTSEYAVADARKNALSFQWKSFNAGSTGTSSHSPAADDSDGSQNDEVQGVAYFLIQPPSAGGATPKRSQVVWF